MKVESGQLRRWVIQGGTHPVDYGTPGFMTGDTFLVTGRNQRSINAYHILLNNGIVKSCAEVNIEMESEVLDETR